MKANLVDLCSCKHKIYEGYIYHSFFFQIEIHFLLLFHFYALEKSKLRFAIRYSFPLPLWTRPALLMKESAVESWKTVVPDRPMTIVSVNCVAAMCVGQPGDARVGGRHCNGHLRTPWTALSGTGGVVHEPVREDGAPIPVLTVHHDGRGIPGMHCRHRNNTASRSGLKAS